MLDCWGEKEWGFAAAIREAGENMRAHPDHLPREDIREVPSALLGIEENSRVTTSTTSLSTGAGPVRCVRRSDGAFQEADGFSRHRSPFSRSVPGRCGCGLGIAHVCFAPASRAHRSPCVCICKGSPGRCAQLHTTSPAASAAITCMEPCRCHRARALATGGTRVGRHSNALPTPSLSGHRPCLLPAFPQLSAVHVRAPSCRFGGGGRWVATATATCGRGVPARGCTRASSSIIGTARAQHGHSTVCSAAFLSTACGPHEGVPAQPQPRSRYLADRECNSGGTCRPHDCRPSAVRATVC